MTIHSFSLRGAAGRIECLLKAPSTGAPPRGSAVVCHPHPLHGGTMHNKVVHATAGAVARAGIPVVRFNFRGAGLSSGEHDQGVGEQEDLGVVLEDLRKRYPGLPILVTGFSFGSYVALKRGCAEKGVFSLIGIGLPASLYDFSFLQGCRVPVTLIQGERDPFGSIEEVGRLADRVPDSSGGGRVLAIEGADHFFAGHLPDLARRVTESIPADLTST